MRHLQSLLACALLALAALACAWPALDKSSLFTAASSTTADTPQQTATVSGQSLPEGWTAMPAGARSTYLGIHGGTVPVSLLVSRDGMSLVSFVGQTGNDFLELLRRADVRLPSLLTSILGSSHGAPVHRGQHLPAAPPQSGGTELSSAYRSPLSRPSPLKESCLCEKAAS